MDRVSFPLLYFKIEPWNADPTLTQSNAKLKQPCLFLQFRQFFCFSKKSLGLAVNISFGCSNWPLPFILFYNTLYERALCRHNSKELDSFHLPQPAAVESCVTT